MTPLLRQHAFRRDSRWPLHIILLPRAGVSLPLMMTVAEWRWLRTREPAYRISSEALGERSRYPVRARRRVRHGLVL